MLSTCYVPDEEQRSRRELLRHRMKLVKTRTDVRNRIHSLLNKHGLRIPYKTTFSKKAVAWLKMQSLGFMDDAILRTDLAILEAVYEQVGSWRRRLRPSQRTTFRDILAVGFLNPCG
jgi:transposase